MKGKFFESTSRSVLKSVTFRIVMIISDGVIVYAVTRKLDLAITVIILRNTAAMVLYYLHERFWNTVRWGKKRN